MPKLLAVEDRDVRPTLSRNLIIFVLVLMHRYTGMDLVPSSIDRSHAFPRTLPS